MTVLFWCAEHSDTMADTKEAEAEITLETYDKHHVKVPKSIATRSAIINMMIEGEPVFIVLPTECLPLLRAPCWLMSAGSETDLLCLE